MKNNNLIILLQIWLLLLVVFSVNKTTGKATCTRIPPNCEFYSMEKSTPNMWLTCENKFDTNMLTAFKLFQDECAPGNNNSKRYPDYMISVKSSPRFEIVNESFQVFRLREFLKPSYYLRLLEIKGFDIESTIYLPDTILEIYTDFNLYKQYRLVTDCEDFVASKNRGFIFRSENYSTLNDNFNWVRAVFIIKPKIKHPICSLFFRNARISLLNFKYLTNSFFMKSMITFIDPKSIDNDLGLNSKIRILQIQEAYGIDINSKFLHKGIFNIQTFKCTGLVNSIDANIFESFRQLKFFSFNSEEILRVIRKQGIAWIKSINSKVKVDINNDTDLEKNKYEFAVIVLNRDREYVVDSRDLFFHDEDFCLFADFPFQQLIYFHKMWDEIDVLNFNKTSPSCTELWLYQYYRQIRKYIKFLHQKSLEASNFTKCRFKERINMCNLKNRNNSLQMTQIRSQFEPYDYVLTLEFLFIILGQLLSAFGILTNIVCIYAIYHEKNRRTMQEKQYTYMSFYCLFNCIIFMIQIFSLVNECQMFGIYCSSIRHLPGVQYIKIISGEYLNSVCRLMTNFAYLGFSLCRLSRVDKDHNRFVGYIYSLNIKKYIAVSLVVSGGLSVCKAVQYEVNSDYPESPQPYSFTENLKLAEWELNSNYVAIFVINIIYNIFTYFLFVFVHLIVDLLLISKLWHIIREKEAKIKKMDKSAKEIEKITKENEESKRRAVFMVIFNSTLNFFFKIPLMITSVNDLRLLIQRPYFQLENRYPKYFSLLNQIDQFDYKFSYKFFCSTVKTCQVFQIFGNCLFLFSLTTIVFFLKHFDKNFKSAYDKTVGRFYKNYRKTNANKTFEKLIESLLIKPIGNN